MLSAVIASFSLAETEGQNNDALMHLAMANDTYFLAIADGVGSASHGGEAARSAIATCVEFAETLNFASLFREARLRLSTAAAENGGQWSTTLTACLLSESGARFGHVGDTRIYQLRGNGLVSRTRDQTELERLIEEGVISKARANRYPRKNVLLSVLNEDGTYDLQESNFDLQNKDRILLVSDGVYKLVEKREIVELSKGNQSVLEFMKTLQELIVSKGLVDDASALCAELTIT